MRIALISFDFGESVVPLASALANDAAVHLALPRNEVDPFRAVLDPRVDVLAFDKPRLRQPARQLATMNAIVRSVRAFDPDVVHVQQGHLWFNWTLPAFRRVPLVLTIHDPRHHLGDRGARRTPQWVSDRGFRRADEIIVHAQYLKAQVVEGWGILDERVHVMPLAMVDAPPRREPSTNPRRVLFFGRIWPYKGLEYLIAAEPAVSAAVPDVEFVIAGDGEPLDRYRAAMTHPERFHVEQGFISYERRDELFDEAAVVVLPHVEATQTGLVPVAYMHARPVVASAVGGIPEVVEHERTGLLVAPRDSAQLGDALIGLLTDERRRREMGAAARRSFETRFASEVLAASTSAVYRRAVEASKAARH
jgi:glycosyltransferase involved in cell wall biosynthesis